ncbi:MAG: hypothetical protein QW304_07760 [Thermoproteota archaeon]
MPDFPPLNVIATLGTVVSGGLTASIQTGRLEHVGTIGTVQAGNVTASITGTLPTSVKETVGLQPGGTVSATVIGTVTVSVKETVGLTQGGTILASILGTLKPIESVATIGSILEGKLTASISSGVLTQVSTIAEGKITASISSGVLTQVSTIAEGKITASIFNIHAAVYEGSILPVKDALTARVLVYRPIPGGTLVPTDVTGTIAVIGTILGTLKPIESVATIGSILEGKLTASISGGVLTQIASIAEGKITASISGGILTQLASISEGKVTASISGGILDRVASISSGRISLAGGDLGSVTQIGLIASVAEGKITASIFNIHAAVYEGSILPVKEALTARVLIYRPIPGGTLVPTDVTGTTAVIGTILGTLKPIESVATIGSILEGKLTASISSGVLTQVSTIAEGKITASIRSGILDQVIFLGTVATVIEGKITASIRSGILDQVRHTGTIGTILSGNVTASISSGSVSADVSPAANYVTLNTSATVTNTPGRLLGVLVSSEGQAATILILNYGAPNPLSTILARIIVGTADVAGFMTDRGIRFSTLVASVIGAGVIANIYRL